MCTFLFKNKNKHKNKKQTFALTTIEWDDLLSLLYWQVTEMLGNGGANACLWCTAFLNDKELHFLAKPLATTIKPPTEITCITSNSSLSSHPKIPKAWSLVFSFERNSGLRSKLALQAISGLLTWKDCPEQGASDQTAAGAAGWWRV